MCKYVVLLCFACRLIFIVHNITLLTVFIQSHAIKVSVASLCVSAETVHLYFSNVTRC